MSVAEDILRRIIAERTMWHCLDDDGTLILDGAIDLSGEEVRYVKQLHIETHASE